MVGERRVAPTYTRHGRGDWHGGHWGGGGYRYPGYGGYGYRPYYPSGYRPYYGGYYGGWGWGYGGYYGGGYYGGYWGYGSGWGWGWGWAPVIGFGVGVAVGYGFGYGTCCNSCVSYPTTTYVIEESPIYYDEVPPDVIVEEAPVVIENDVVIEDEAPAAAPAFPEPVAQGAADDTEDLPGPVAPPAAANPSFGRGVEAFLAGRFDDAQTFLQTAVNVDPDNGEAWMAHTYASFMLGDYEKSADGIARVAQMGGFPRGYRFNPQGLFEKPETYDAALAKLDERVAADASDLDALTMRAYLHVAEGERDQAEDAIHRLLMQRPDDPTAPILSLALLPQLPAEQAAAEGGDDR